MSTLPHACAACLPHVPGAQEEKRNLDLRIRHEVAEAKRIQQQTGCTWTNALMLAAGKASGHVVFVTVKD